MPTDNELVYGSLLNVERLRVKDGDFDCLRIDHRFIF